jgi:hypothetical protein
LLVAAGAVAALGSKHAWASIARAVSLAELCRASERAVVARAVDYQCRWEPVGGRRRIVTYTRLVLDETLAGPADAEIMVRTLGGQVGDIGQVVHGEALLLIDEHALLFLMPSSDGVLGVTAMAQGHYPIRDGKMRASPRAPELIDAERSALKALAGKSVPDALGLVRKAWHDAH